MNPWWVRDRLGVLGSRTGLGDWRWQRENWMRKLGPLEDLRVRHLTVSANTNVSTSS